MKAVAGYMQTFSPILLRELSRSARTTGHLLTNSAANSLRTILKAMHTQLLNVRDVVYVW